MERTFVIGPEHPEPVRAAAIRRLWFASHVVTVGEKWRKGDRSEDGAPRNISPGEMEGRKRTLRAKLSTAIRIESELHTADSIINRFVQMLDERVCSWVLGRHVVLRIRSSHRRKNPADAAGVVRGRSIKEEPTADASSRASCHWRCRGAGPWHKLRAK